jgi:hypothetical protein
MKRSPKDVPRIGREIDAVEVRKAADVESARFLAAKEPEVRVQAATAILDTWKRLRKVVEDAGIHSDRFDQVEATHAELLQLARGVDVAAQETALIALSLSVEKLARVADGVITLADPVAQLRLRPAPLPPAERDARLQAARTKLGGTARSMAEAMRKVVAARKAEGVPLHSTFSSEAQAMYAVAATNFALGLVPVVPVQPGTTSQSAPWGTFKVRSAVPPAEAAVRFAASPPLPVRTELLESRFGSVKLAPLRPAPGPEGGNDAGG